MAASIAPECNDLKECEVTVAHIMKDKANSWSAQEIWHLLSEVVQREYAPFLLISLLEAQIKTYRVPPWQHRLYWMRRTLRQVQVLFDCMFATQPGFCAVVLEKQNYETDLLSYTENAQGTRHWYNARRSAEEHTGDRRWVQSAVMTPTASLAKMPASLTM